MKASEVIALLEEEIKKRGDLDIVLFGHYCAESETFEIMDVEELPRNERNKIIGIWTDIMTG